MRERKVRPSIKHNKKDKISTTYNRPKPPTSITLALLRQMTCVTPLLLILVVASTLAAVTKGLLNRKESPTACINDKTNSCENQEFETSLDETERTMKDLRIKMIKKEILTKLGLKEPPNAKGLPKDHTPLPSPIDIGANSPGENGSGCNYKSSDMDVEDFYGKTQQVVAFLDHLAPECLTSANSQDYPAACFLFNLPKEVHTQELRRVELWVFKLPDPNDSKRSQIFWLSELLDGTGIGGSSSGDINNSDPLVSSSRSKVLKKKTNVRLNGWLSFNITKKVKRWQRTKSYSHTLQIGCKSCGRNVQESPIGSKNGKTPFMLFHIASVAMNRRTKRYDCVPGEKGCCREKLVIDFWDMEWDFVIAPKAYDAYYCKGNCISQSRISLSMQGSTIMVQGYFGFHGMNEKTSDLVPCCGPKKMSNISMLYFDVDAEPYPDGNYPIKFATLPNTVIDSCGCL